MIPSPASSRARKLAILVAICPLLPQLTAQTRPAVETLQSTNKRGFAALDSQQARLALKTFAPACADDGQRLSVLDYAWIDCRLGYGTALGETGNVKDGLAVLAALAAEPLAQQSPNYPVMLTSIGAAHNRLGNNDEAVATLLKALFLARQRNLTSLQVTILNNLGFAYTTTGRLSDAVASHQQAAKIAHDYDDEYGEAQASNNTGLALAALHDYENALKNYNKALGYFQDHRKERDASSTLNNIGEAYLAQQQFGSAAGYLYLADMSLVLQADPSLRSVILDNLAHCDEGMNQGAEAENNYQLALKLAQDSGDKTPQANTLSNLGALHYKRGDESGAIAFFSRALGLEEATGDRDRTASTYTFLRVIAAEQHNLPLAIFYGKMAVNTYQAIRGGLRGLDQKTVDNYAESIEGPYRALIDLLLREGRLAEAEEVLRMLKQQELKQFVRGRQEGATTAATFTPLEKQSVYMLVDILEWQDIASLSDAERTRQGVQARFQDLSDALRANHIDANNWWPALAQQFPAQDTPAKLDVAGQASQLLRKLPRGTAILYTILLHDQLDILLVTVNGSTTKTVPVSKQEVAQTVEAFRIAIRKRSTGEDITVPANQLYNWVITPILKELNAANTNLIAWSLDGALRYMPPNALFDGRQFLIDRYNNVSYSSSNTPELSEFKAPTSYSALGMGVSQEYGSGLVPLDSVPLELNAIIDDKSVVGSHGPLPGKILLDDAFTLRAMEQELRHDYPIIHIATHFVLSASADSSYLLLGGDQLGGGAHKLTLTDFAAMTHRTHSAPLLLTVSACDTAVTDSISVNPQNGSELDSFADLARQGGANSVLATLWDVDDYRSADLMSDFYSFWLNGKKVSKSEALREAERKMLHQQDTSGETVSGMSATTFTSPFYWAPFILSGNWR